MRLRSYCDDAFGKRAYLWIREREGDRILRRSVAALALSHSSSSLESSSCRSAERRSHESDAERIAVSS